MFIHNQVGWLSLPHGSVFTASVTCHKVEHKALLQYSKVHLCYSALTLKVLVATIDAQWEGMGDVGSARYEPALLPPCPTIRVLSYSN